MKFTKKFISLLLAVLMLCGTLTCFSFLTVSAAESESSTETGTGVDEVKTDYLNQVFATPEEKLATMKLMTTKGNYQLYADQNSGEVAVKDLTSGQILFTNPYDIGATTAVESVKMELMSQIIVRYTENGRPKEYFSYEYAAARDQIKVKNIKNGIRVEYTIGREEARRLVPRMIEQSRFETLIRAPLLEYYDNNEENFYFKQFMSYYQLKGLEFCSSDRLKDDLLSVYPVVSDMNIYVFDPTATTVELEKREEDIKTACPNYSYEEMDVDHQMTEYESEDENPPLFKLALEYTLGEDGFSVRLPANGIRFNESKFQLESICVLPYMGAGNIAYDGYTFFPDGSGALFAFEDLVDVTSNSVASKVYGTDYAYHKISGTYQQTVRYPVFGIVEKTRYYDFNEFNESSGETETTTINGMVYDILKKYQNGELTALPTSLTQYNKLIAGLVDAEENIVNRGYVAIIEEGDAMAEIATKHEGVKHPYDSIQMSFYPRPQDTYNMADAISVGTATDWTVVSTRKYVGNYKIHYVMLTDSGIAEQKELPADSWYDATWLGMAMAYRDYLVDKGVLTPLTEEQTSGDIPLYIEAFGTIETVEKIMSIPVEVMKPLTTFQDVQTMYAELAAKGVNNINFKLTGHANGGFFSDVPYKLKWEKSVSKETKFQELIDFANSINDGNYDVLKDYAKENEIFETDEEYAAFEKKVDGMSQNANLGIYPDFDFSYVYRFTDGLFDGLNLRKHAVRTIDDRYTSKRLYLATRQRHTGYFQLAISPAYFSHFYEKLVDNYLTYDNVSGISVASLGDSLNSDFDEDEPYNREDSKSFVQQALEYFTSEKGANLEVMVNGGNAYTWQFVDHILGAPLDSSRYIRASYSVPFLGVVLHGYANFAGSPLNMEGDLNYAKLKAIENGAAVYFTLSYQNTQVLKEDFLTSQYYSIRYDIWFDDVVEIYNDLNTVTKDLQDKLIVGHEFLSGMRVPDVDELYKDIMDDYNAVLDYQNNKAEYEEKLRNEAVADARDKIASTEEQAKAFIQLCLDNYTGMSGAAYLYVTGERSFERRYATFVEADAVLKDVTARYESASEEEKAELEAQLKSAETSRKQARAQLLTYIRNISRVIAVTENAYENLSKLLVDAEEGQLLINSTDGIPQSIIDEIAVQLASTKSMMEQKLGITFDMTVEKAELDTFLHTHITQLILNTYGDGQDTTVGKMENIYDMIKDQTYGLTMNDLELLRYLEANKDLSDTDLVEKYGLDDPKSSVKGLVTYMRELLSDIYTFDPSMSDEAADGEFSEVDEHLIDYYLTMLMARLSALPDNSVIPTLKFNPKRFQDGKETSNTNNISAVTKKIQDAVNKALLNATGAIGKVEDGNYDLEAVYSEENMSKLIDECVKIVNDRVTSSTLTERVEYLGDEAMLRADLRDYIEALYYQKALDKISPATTTTTLKVMKVSSMTKDSLTLIVERFMNSYTNDKATAYETYVALMSDAKVLASVDKIAAALKTGYGDVKAEILEGLSVVAAQKIVGTKAPGLSFETEAKAPVLHLDLPETSEEEGAVTLSAAMKEVDKILKAALAKDPADTEETAIAAVKTYLEAYDFTDGANRDEEIAAYVNYAYTKDAVEAEMAAAIEKATKEIDEIIAAAVPTATDETIAKVVADVTAVLAPLAFVEGVDRDVEIADYVYFVYLTDCTTRIYDNFYYDVALGTADAQIREEVKVLQNAVAAELPENADVYDVYNAVLAALANKDNNVVGLTTAIAAAIPHRATDKNKISDDVLDYYCYLLLNGFEGYSLGEEAPEIGSLSVLNDSQKKNALDQIKSRFNTTIADLINKAKIDTERGAIAALALSDTLKGAEIDLDETVNSVVEYLQDSKFLIQQKDESDADFAARCEAIVPELKAYFQYLYYTAVISELGANKLPTFSVSEIYGADLFTAGQGLKSLLRWYVTQYAGMMTEEEIDSLIGSIVSGDDEEENDPSKYLSDDGRIVAVTYGTPNNEGSYDAYRTFVLNYNNFSVSVVYDGVQYTIPAFSYVVVDY